MTADDRHKLPKTARQPLMNTSLVLRSISEEQTDSIGGRIAQTLNAGDVITLNGDLGAGKTRLVRAIVGGLDGGDVVVNSPTFVIVQQYPVRLPVYHIDAYRLADADEFLALGGEEILAGEAICLIEWAERIADALPDDHLSVTITATSPQARRLMLTSGGPRSAEIIEQLRGN
jgi:tRNA threonylcarbamoyladenosine biosynthesis protein TsaE